MNMDLSEFHLGITEADWITPTSRSYRPPSWPPPRDWVVTEDGYGNVLSRYGDQTWDLSAWAGKSLQLNFGDGQDPRRIEPIEPVNADLLRQVMVWRLWGFRPVRAASTARETFIHLRRVFVVCDKEGILASDLWRFPKVIDRVIERLPSSTFEPLITELHRLLDARDQLGFVIVNTDGIKRIAAANPGHEHIQTPYIPPRIWTYQITRLRKCLDDFLANHQQVEECYKFCLDAYIHNYGSLSGAMTRQSGTHVYMNPFVVQDLEKPGRRTGRVYYGSFEQTAERFGIKALLERWVEPDPSFGYTIAQLTTYLNLVQHAGLYYIANFTLQRISEVMSLRVECLVFENDEVLGRVPIICGETTKTQPDSDARWPTSPSVEVAVKAKTIVSRLRMTCVVNDPIARPSEEDLANPYLFNRSYEPWGGSKMSHYDIRPKARSYGGVVAAYSKLFDLEQLRITEEDLRVARMITPGLPEEEFAVGLIWPLAAHQLRRTGAVNMFASGLLSDSTMQYQMKHSTRLMPLYYGRGHTKLHLNEGVEKVVISAMYEVMSMQVLAAVGDRFLSPHGQNKKNEIVVNLISGRDAKALAKAARGGDVSFHENRLGACTSRTNCSYGGVESIARCAGGDGYKPCIDVLYDQNKAKSIELELEKVEQELGRFPIGSPRHNALLVEKRGMENFLNVIRN